MALKGHTKIELTNVNTGEVETYEDDNMVTNALEDLFHPLGCCGSTIINSDRLVYNNNRTINNNNFLRTVTGGLLLFDKTIADDPKITTPPTGVKAVGRGCYRVYTGQDPTLGSYNISESGKIYDGYGYKHVWDFQTNQGNGKISCASLTTALGGFIGIGSANYYGDYPSGSHEYNFPCYRNIKVNGADGERPVYLNGNTNEIFFLQEAGHHGRFIHCNYSMQGSGSVNQETLFIKTGKLKFRKARFPFNSLSIFDFGGQNNSFLRTVENLELELKEVKDIVPEEAKTTGTSSNHYCFNYKMFQDGKYLIFMMSIIKTNNINNEIIHYFQPGEEIFHIWKIDATTLTSKIDENEGKEVNKYEYYKIINTTDGEIPLFFSASHSYNYSLQTMPSDANYYYSSSSSHNIYNTNTCSYMVANSENIVCYYRQKGSSQFTIIKIDYLRNQEVSNIYLAKDNNEMPIWPSIPSFHLHFFDKNRLYFYPYSSIYDGQYVHVIDLQENIIGDLPVAINTLGTYAYSNRYFYSGSIIKIDGISEAIFAHCTHLDKDDKGYNSEEDTDGFYVRMFHMPNMLITINNLPQTITKTNDQTMKVTYTLVDDNYEVD